MNLSLQQRQLKEAIVEYSLFDPLFYLNCYADVRAANLDPLEHFINYGVNELRDPCASFSSSGYFYRFPDAKATSLSAIEHYLHIGRLLGRHKKTILNGFRQYKVNRPTILLAGHQVEKQLFGAELSLIDVAEMLHQLDFNVVVALPSAKNKGYVDLLLQKVFMVSVVPQSWWQADREVMASVVTQFRQLFDRFNIQAVHLNTLVHYEPAIAAREHGVPVIVHVRELPLIDNALCKSLNATPAQVKQFVLSFADHVIANSHFTASFFQDIPCSVVYNVFNTQRSSHIIELESELLDTVEIKDLSLPVKPLTVGMLSSNLPKKGLDDFISIAIAFSDKNAELAFELIGPLNEHVLNYQRELDAKGITNIRFTDYCDDIQKLLSNVDVLLNLSHFQESFGRTVLEAFFARKVVIAYRWGALPELIDHAKTGYLTPYRDVNTVIAYLEHLSQNRDELVLVANAAFQTANTKFNFYSVCKQLAAAYHNLELYSCKDLAKIN